MHGELDETKEVLDDDMQGDLNIFWIIKFLFRLSLNISIGVENLKSQMPTTPYSQQK